MKGKCQLWNKGLQRECPRWIKSVDTQAKHYDNPNCNLLSSCSSSVSVSATAE